MRFRALLALLLAPMIMAQQSVELSRSTITGYVRAAGRPVAFATVYARSNAERQQTKTDSKGHYIIFSLPAGAYKLTAYDSTHRWRSCVPAHIEVQAGFHYSVDVLVNRRC